MKNNNDQNLIKKYFQGDEKALEILIKVYLKPIYSFVYRYVNNEQDAEDITQEVFVKVWRNLKKFNPQKNHFLTLIDKQQKSFKTWIFSIAKNTSIDWLKKKKAIPFSNFENEKGENPLTETLADPAPLPNEIFERANIAEILNSATQQLLPKYRMILSLRYNDHFNFREISETLSEPLNTIKSRHRRAIILLKKLLPKT